MNAHNIPLGRKNRYPSFEPRNAFTNTAFSFGRCGWRTSDAKSWGSALVILSVGLPSAAFSRAESAQSKRVLRSSDTAAAAMASEPPIALGFGAVSGIVKTRGSIGGGGPRRS